MRITLQLLERHGACRDQRLLFAKTFPKGAKVTTANLAKAVAAGLQISWLECCIPEEKRAAYDAATAPARAAYNAAEVQARAAHNAAAAPAPAPATAQAWAAYDAATAPARAAYNAAEAQAWAACNAAVAQALIAAFSEE